MKIRNTLLLLCLSSVGVYTAEGQTTNMALRLNGQEKVACGTVSEMAALAEYTVQFLIAPEKWNASSFIYRAGNNDNEFSARLSATPGELVFKAGGKEIKVQGLKEKGWSQITLSVTSQNTEVRVNGVKSATVSGGFEIPTSLSSLMLGEGFEGRMDEFRLWNAVLSADDTDYLMQQNTVTKFHPQWENLVLYYKFDQDKCAGNIVDYKFAHHATMSGSINREPVTDNSFFRYRMVSGYTDFNRHCDRTQIDRDMHLMTNDLIVLNASVNGYTGEITMNAPDNATLSGGCSYLESHAGRNGVLNFDGTGVMNLGDHVVKPGSPAGTALTFEGWFNLADWKEGAYLLKKEENAQKRINIRLGKAATKELVVEAGEWTAVFTNGLKDVKTWQHIAVVVNPEAGRNKIRLYVNNELQNAPAITKPEGQSSFEIMNVNADGFIGEAYAGMMDEIMMWRSAKSAFAADMDGTNPELKFPGGGNGAIYLDAYWRFDEPADPGLNMRGWQGMLKQIRDQYAGYRGYKIRLGLITPTSYANGGKVWPDYIGKPEWRDNLAAGVEKLLPYCDGIDVDFEWLDNNPNNPKWAAYGEMVKRLRKVIPADKVFSVSLHPVSYTLPTTEDVLGAIDFITFQNYGPRPTSLYYDAYENFYTKALNYGIPAEKIRLSMATTVVRTDNSGKNVNGYRNIDLSQITADSNQTMLGGYSYTFNGVNEVKKKMRLLVDKNTGGCMYFDMGNDISVQHELSLIRALNTVIASNVDTLVTEVPPVTSLEEIKGNNSAQLTLYPNPTSDYITVKGDLGTDMMRCEISSLKGQLISSATVSDDKRTIALGHLPSGTYFLRLYNAEKIFTEKVQVK